MILAILQGSRNNRINSDRLLMSLQVYFRQLSATDTVLDAKQNGSENAISILL